MIETLCCQRLTAAAAAFSITLPLESLASAAAAAFAIILPPESLVKCAVGISK
jgi:hypothetical protein